MRTGKELRITETVTQQPSEDRQQQKQPPYCLRNATPPSRETSYDCY